MWHNPSHLGTYGQLQQPTSSFSSFTLPTYPTPKYHHHSSVILHAVEAPGIDLKLAIRSFPIPPIATTVGFLRLKLCVYLL